jgi:putative ABC transport system permease protein
MKLALLALSSLRFYRRHPWQLLLAVAGIALGVAVFVGIELANDSARRAFDASSSAASEQTTHRLLPTANVLPESVYFDLKRDRHYVASTPVVEAAAALELPNGRNLPVTLNGIDLIEESIVRGLRSTPVRIDDPTRLLAEAATVIVPESIATEYRLAVGSTLTIRAAGREFDVVVIGTSDDGRNAGTELITDIATAQELAGLTGALTRIDLKLEDSAAALLASDPPAGSVLVPAATEDPTLLELTRAFNTNLTALGLLALVVGMFLIYSTISFTIVQRWRSIAVLRALGLDRRDLMVKLLGEALLIGVTGTLLGLLLGRQLSAGLLELVLRTLDDLYFRRALRASDASNWIYLLSAALGIGATLVSALIPAVIASRREITSATRSRVERSAKRLADRFGWAALPTAAIAGVILLVADRGLWQAFVAIFLIIVAGAMLIPLATHALMRLIERPVARLAGLTGSMAIRGVTDSLSRTGVATAALAVAVATVMSIGLMIASFRASLIEWIDTTVTADLYVDVDPDWRGDLATALEQIEALPDVVGISRARVTGIVTEIGPLDLRAAAPGPEGYGIDVTAPDGAEAGSLLAADRALLVSEPLAYRLDLQPGDAIVLPTADGPQSFDIAGIYRDYNTAGVELVLSLESYRRWFNDPTLTSIGIHLAAGADEAAVTAAIRQIVGGDRPARIRSTAFIREISLVIFDRTFQVTEVLRLLAAVVAFLGILSALMALQLERERDFAVLRSLGMSVRQVFGQNLVQTSLLGLTAGLAAIPLGTVLAWLLVHVINRRSFGWSMDFIVSADAVLAGVAMAIAAAVLAGIYPALVGARADMGLAWQDE